MATINVYLTFNGNCKSAFDFYQSVFGGELTNISTYGEMPPGGDNPPIFENEKDRIMHVSLPLSNGSVLMGCDTGGEWAKGFTSGNNFSLSIHTESKEEADRIFNDLSKGGVVSMPMNETFWGSYFGMLNDKFGIAWMVSFEKAQPV